ncbi:MAG: ATP-grasp domain-containing protein [Rhodocyclaceae bacterium]|nr:ATP-grasp domain-containing protein [Rhodocyclaceae bacterium]
MRVWFNKTFSSIHNALRLIRAADPGRNYELVASSPNPNALVRLAVDAFHEEPAGLRGLAYLEWCAAFCRRERIDIFVPGKEAALIAGEREYFDACGTRVLSCATRPTLDLLHDKARFYAMVDCPEAPPPDWLACASPAQFDDAYACLKREHAELCIKPAVSVYGIGFRRVREDCSAWHLFAGGHDYQIDLPSLRAMLQEQAEFPVLLVMEFLGGHEYSVDCVASHGNLKFAVARRKPLRAGQGQTIDTRADIEAACARIVRQFGLNGWVNIQFREGRRGLRLLEVNPRMSGGIAMACLAGPNLPFLGLAGFDRGYDRLDAPAATAGLRVAELNHAVALQ